MPDALASNAGDRYHFIYAARRMLDMLHPRSGLELIVMENVAEEDRLWADSPETFLAADLTEYSGGRNTTEASKIVIVQVKYSPTNPNGTWTLNRLCQNKKSSTGNDKPGTSVLRKLANAFNAIYSELGETTRDKLKVKLFTNQNLADDLRKHLAQAQTLLAGRTGTEGSRLLRNTPAELRDTLERLQQGTTLSWKRLATFLQCWDLSGFGQAMLTEQEVQLFKLLNQYVDGGLHFGALYNFVSEHALPDRSTEITRDKIYALLQIRHTDFFPAPTQFEPISNLLFTENAQRLIAEIRNQGKGVLFVHGASGTGKSTTLQLVQKHQENNAVTVIYDCFAGGAGLRPGTERFPYKECFVQITNELDSRLHTNIFATTKLDYRELVLRFNEAIAKAALLAERNGQRLVIAIDAVDNAIDAASDHPIRKNECFVPLLWNIEWPNNCTVIVSARTENRAKLDIQCDYREVTIEGFSSQEVAEYLRAFWPDVTDELVAFAHNRTNGNPSVLSKLVEAAAHESQANLFTLVDDKARETAFEYYQEQCPKRLGNEADRLLLAVLRESTQFISLDTLTSIVQRPVAEVRAIVESLYFGLRISDSGEIRWADQDFLDFTRELVQSMVSQARDLLADYCRINHETDSYAEQNLSRHFYLAGRYGSLLEWWLAEEQLPKRMAALKPHEEDVLEDIQYGLLAALQIDSPRDALKLLSIAAEVLEGRDVFSRAIKDYPTVAVECGYLNRLLSYLEAHETGLDLVSNYFAIARALAEGKKRLDIAEDLVERGFVIAAEEEWKRFSREGVFDGDMVHNIALYQSHAFGLEYALERMKQWKPQETVYPLYTTLIRDWSSSQGEGEKVFETLKRFELNNEQRAYCLAGLLAAPRIKLEQATHEELAKAVLGFLEIGTIQPHDISGIIVNILENLLAQGLLQTAQDFLNCWSVSAPSSHHSDMSDFLKQKAVETVLDINPFSPDGFELAPSPDSEETSDYRERADELEKIRYKMRLTFPSLICRTKALMGAPENEVLQEVQNGLNLWKRSTPPYWYQFYQPDCVRMACELLEAITLLPTYQIDVVREICAVANEVTNSTNHWGHTRYADILSRDNRYHVEAERLIHCRQKAVELPDYRASEAVETLLELCPIAARFDSELAYRIFTKARIAASEWDGHVGGRAFALLRTASHAHSRAEIHQDQLSRLAAVFEYMKRVAFGDTNPRLDEAIHLIACIQPDFALDTLKRLDESDLMGLTEGVGSVALGLLDAQSVSAELVLPLTHIVSSIQEGIAIYKQSIEQLLEVGKGIEQVLAAFAKYIRTEEIRERRADKAHEFVRWANSLGLSDYSTVQFMERFANELAELGSDKDDQPYLPRADTERENVLFLRFQKEMRISPKHALATLEQAEREDVESLRKHEIEQIVDVMVDSIPSADIPTLFPIVEVWGTHRFTPEVFSLTARIANQVRFSDRIAEAIVASWQRLLNPINIHQLTREYYDEHLIAILDCQHVEVKEKLNLIITAVANLLRELKGDDLYRLVGMLGELLPPSDTIEVFDTLLRRATNRLPENFAIVQPQVEIDPQAALIKFLSDYLGHPEQSRRWRVLYALVDVALNVPEPTLALLTTELADNTHERWMTKREWLLFLLHHLSLRDAVCLVPYADVFLQHALDKDFPHAKMRYHAKEILLNIEKVEPGTLSVELLEQVEQVNEPIAYVTRDELENGHKPYTGTLWNQRCDELFTFDSIDTLPYWYSPIGQCFGGHRCHVADIAYKWIVDKWDITNAICAQDRERTRQTYSYDDVSHRHGGEPAVETLERYAERHGMFMAAGELINTQPVFFAGEREGDRWHDWIRYRLRAADPALTSRFLDSPPLIADNYGIFTTEYEEWVKKNIEAEFKQELFTDSHLNWIVVDSSRVGSFDHRYFGASVSSALVSRETGQALACLVSSQDDFVPLPRVNPSYDTILPELEHDLANRGDYYIHAENEIENEPFVLKAWLAEWHQEMPFHGHDPKWPKLGRAFTLPDADFCNKLGLRREPISLKWMNNAGQDIAYHEVWHDSEGHGDFAEYVHGYRLVVRRDALCDYLKQTGLNMVFVIRLRRQRPYNYRYRDSEYDPGTSRAYILRSDGRLETMMKADLVEKGKQLVKELGGEREPFLRKWMAHYLAELMERTESANEQKAQTAKDKCAKIITKLWEQGIERDVTQLRNKLWRLIPISSDDIDYNSLGNALANPEQVKKLDESTIKIYFSLADVEDWLVRILAISHVINTPEEEIEDESVNRLMQQENGKLMVKRIAKLFPAFAELEITDLVAVDRQVSVALRAIYQLRLILLGVEGGESCKE